MYSVSVRIWRIKVPNKSYESQDAYATHIKNSEFLGTSALDARNGRKGFQKGDFRLWAVSAKKPKRHLFRKPIVGASTFATFSGVFCHKDFEFSKNLGIRVREHFELGPLY